jgi:hypothetical protein
MTTTLIVMEPNSKWPGHVKDSDVVAVGDADEGLLGMTRERLGSLRGRGQRIRVAVLACNEAVDPVSVVRRREVAQELLTAIASVGRGHLVLSAGETASMPLRHNLLSLAGTLSLEIEGTTAMVSVKFGENLREIGLADGIGSELLARAPRRSECVPA